MSYPHVCNPLQVATFRASLWGTPTLHPAGGPGGAQDALTVRPYVTGKHHALSSHLLLSESMAQGHRPPRAPADAGLLHRTTPVSFEPAHAGRLRRLGWSAAVH